MTDNNRFQLQNDRDQYDLNHEKEELEKRLSQSEILLEKLQKDRIMDVNIFSPRNLEPYADEQIRIARAEIETLKEKIQYTERMIQDEQEADMDSGKDNVSRETLKTELLMTDESSGLNDISKSQEESHELKDAKDNKIEIQETSENIPEKNTSKKSEFKKSIEIKKSDKLENEKSIENLKEKEEREESQERCIKENNEESKGSPENDGMLNYRENKTSDIKKEKTDTSIKAIFGQTMEEFSERIRNEKKSADKRRAENEALIIGEPNGNEPGKEGHTDQFEQITSENQKDQSDREKTEIQSEHSTTDNRTLTASNIDKTDHKLISEDKQKSEKNQIADENQISEVKEIADENQISEEKEIADENQISENKQISEDNSSSETETFASSLSAAINDNVLKNLYLSHLLDQKEDSDASLVIPTTEKTDTDQKINLEDKNISGTGDNTGTQSVDAENLLSFLNSIYKKTEVSLALLNGNKNRCKSELKDIMKLIKEYAQDIRKQ